MNKEKLHISTFDLAPCKEEGYIIKDGAYYSPERWSKLIGTEDFEKWKSEMQISLNNLNGLTKKTINILNYENIYYVGNLVQKNETELLLIRNFGKKTLNQVKKALSFIHLSLGIPFNDILTKK